MNIHEYQAKELLAKFGVPVPAGHAAMTVEDAVRAAKMLPGPLWVVKAQIHAGGRGKGKFKELGPDAKGGVRLARSIDEVRSNAEEMLDNVNAFSPKSDLDQSKAAAVRARYVKEGIPIGSRPAGDDAPMTALLDKLAARLAFERSGVRLYEALIQKREAVGGTSKPTIADLTHIRDEELDHMHLLEECIADLGGDPTMVTPAAGNRP